MFYNCLLWFCQQISTLAMAFRRVKVRRASHDISRLLAELNVLSFHPEWMLLLLMCHRMDLSKQQRLLMHVDLLLEMRIMGRGKTTLYHPVSEAFFAFMSD